MSSTIDPAKLKVVELRSELSARGLDTKGNKPVLVKRLKDALEQELQQELPDTSIVDTSTEDLNSSQTEETTEKQDESQPEEQTTAEEKADIAAEQKMEVEEDENKADSVAKSEEPQDRNEKDEVNVPEKENGPEEQKYSSVENGDSGEQQDNADEAKKSESEENQVDDKQQTQENSEPRGDKRKRSSPSPDANQSKRAKSPIKEDEPPIDKDKVQLSWYDSDLHLQVDKENFLSAKPYHEGVFGYAWAGVRATHGISSGKVCFEVKITEELKWEDITKTSDKNKSDKEKQPAESTPNDSEKQETPKEKEGEDAEKPEEKDKEKPAEEEAENSQENSEAETGKSEESKAEEQAEDGDQAEPEKMEVEEPAEDIATHLFRVGWSLPNTGLQLGEFKYSYGYESSGKFVTDKEFSEYGVKFGVGDVIGSYLEINESGIKITFAVNGSVQPVAVEVPREELPESFALFPHVLSRNYAFELNLGGRDDPWFPAIFSDYAYVEDAENKVQGPVRPETRSECEVIMMCGLPASGKTHWVNQWVEKNPEKRYTVIGNTQLLEKMTIDGNPLKKNYKSHWNLILDKLQKSLNKILEVAALRRRNYVIDQTNVIPSVQRRRMRSFEGFNRRAVVLVLNDEEQAKRRAQQESEDNKNDTDTAILELKADMSVPRVGSWLEKVEFPELAEAEAREIVKKYNQQGKSAGYGNQYGQRRDYRNNNRSSRWQNNRRDYRSGGGYRDNRNYPGGRFERGGGPRPGWQNSRPGWGRNDHRGPNGGQRDWRSPRGGGQERGQRNSYSSSRGSWQGGASYPQSGGSWSQGKRDWGQSQGHWGQNQAWGAQGQAGWKYSQGYNQNYGGYSNYYYGQYPQNWSNSQANHHPSK